MISLTYLGFLSFLIETVSLCLKQRIIDIIIIVTKPLRFIYGDPKEKRKNGPGSYSDVYQHKINYTELKHLRS